MRWQDVPIPRQMQGLERDKRGYPIPVNVGRDRNGAPMFANNPADVRERLFKTDCCSICGRKLSRGRWAVGGPASAFHPQGAYLDPPVHLECGQYALQVCPYILSPGYTKPIAGKLMEKNAAAGIQVLIDPTVINNRPDPFVMVMHVGQEYSYEPNGTIHSWKPKRPHRRYEYWSNGVRLSESDGLGRVQSYFETSKDLLFDPSKWRTPTPYVVLGGSGRKA